MYGELGGNLMVEMVEKADELLMPVARFALRDDRAIQHVERGEQRGGAMAVVVVSHAFEVTSPIGSTGWVRSSACTWLFSSTHSTSALSGGLRYSPTTSRTFSTKKGSVESLKLLLRCG